ncbi:Lactose permease [Colletotrichum viniferum]|nr:Lactose permease [Colletotrichum viniferum]
MEKHTSATEHHIEASTSAVEAEKGDLNNRHVKQVNVQSVALADAIAKDKPDYKSATQMNLYAMMALCVLNGVMNGYDGSVMSAINAMDPFQDRFKIGLTGELNGAVFSIYTVGNIVGSLVCGYIMDRWGRRACMFSGATSIILGSVLQASSYQLPQFFVGRFIVGIGTPMCATSAPVFLVEIAYPTWRGLAGGLYNVLGWYIGANIAAWTCYGTNFIPNDWSWRIPYIVQLTPATIVVSLAWFLPESPRWLWSQGKTERAKSILTKYHGNKNPNSALVKLEIDEIQESLEREQEMNNHNWNYKILVNNRPNRYRMWLVMLVAVFAQFIGGAVISYYLPAMVRGIGITDSRRQLLLNGLNTVTSFVGGLCGSFFVDKVGRRPLFLWGTFLTGLVYIPINVLAARAENSEEGSLPTSQAYSFIAMIFLYGIFWSFCWTPLQALYPSEILNNEIRAKGMGVKGFISGVASFINTYGTSVSLKHIGWKTYTIFLILHFVHLVLMYMACVETKERTLEEIEEIFNDPKPVKRSLQKTRVLIDNGGVKVKDDV